MGKLAGGSERSGSWRRGVLVTRAHFTIGRDQARKRPKRRLPGMMALDEVATRHAQRASEIIVVHQVGDGCLPLAGTVGDEQVTAGLGSESFEGRGRRDDW